MKVIPSKTEYMWVNESGTVRLRRVESFWSDPSQKSSSKREWKGLQEDNEISNIVWVAEVSTDQKTRDRTEDGSYV